MSRASRVVVDTLSVQNDMPRTGHSHLEQFDYSASSEKLACSVGDSPTGERVRDPVAWVAFVEETNRMKPTDKAILGMVSESPGRNASEPRNGLDKIKSESRAPYGRAKAA